MCSCYTLDSTLGGMLRRAWKAKRQILIYFVIGLLLWQGYERYSLNPSYAAYLASHIDVRIRFLDSEQRQGQSYLVNFGNTQRMQYGVISLSYSGAEVTSTQTWCIYFNTVRLLRLASSERNYTIKHVSGWLQAICPKTSSVTLQPGETKELYFNVDGVMVTKTDILPNWYIVIAGLEPEVLVGTAGESLSFVSNFDTPSKWKIGYGDRYDPLSPADRYQLNANIADLGTDNSPWDVMHVIPSPKMVNVLSADRVQWSSWRWRIFVEEGAEDFQDTARYLSDKKNMHITSRRPTQNCVMFRYDSTLNNSEAYSVRILTEAQSVIIHAKTATGAFYAVQTLLAIDTNTGNSGLPSLHIEDSPRFPFRGLHVDVARNFIRKETLMKIIEVMGAYKLNKFHFHLTDDEGWRLEIPGLEELTEIGSKRCHDINETMCLLPHLGSHPSRHGVGTEYYSAVDYRAILTQATQHHIQVIPEIDIPGHSRAAVIAMKNRYYRLQNAHRQTESGKYLLTEFGDASRYSTVQNYDDNTINPCLNSTYDFIEHIVKTLVHLHHDIQPLKVFHFGFDEVSSSAWSLSQSCKLLFVNLSKHGSTMAQSIKLYLWSRVSDIAHRYGVDVAAWEDGVMRSDVEPYPRSTFTQKHVYVNSWKEIYSSYNLANLGYEVIMSHASHLYLDHPQEPDPEHRGLYWAGRYTDTRKVWGFTPMDIYSTAKYTKSGHLQSRTSVCGVNDRKCPPLKKPHNVIGMQASVWTELIRTDSQFWSMLLPRLLAVAERAWHLDQWESGKQSDAQIKHRSWERFANRVGHVELERLDRVFGVNYLVPAPGAMKTPNGYKVNTAYPGLQIETSTDRLHWTPVDTTKLVTKDFSYLRTRSADGKRTSREVKIGVKGVLSEQ